MDGGVRSIRMKLRVPLAVGGGHTRKAARWRWRSRGNVRGDRAGSPFILLNGNHRRLSSCQATSRKTASAYSDFTSPGLKTRRLPASLLVSSSTSLYTMIALSYRERASIILEESERRKRREVGQPETTLDWNLRVVHGTRCELKINKTSNVSMIIASWIKCNLLTSNIIK